VLGTLRIRTADNGLEMVLEDAAGGGGAFASAIPWSNEHRRHPHRIAEIVDRPNLGHLGEEGPRLIGIQALPGSSAVFWLPGGPVCEWSPCIHSRTLGGACRDLEHKKCYPQKDSLRPSPGLNVGGPIRWSMISSDAGVDLRRVETAAAG
jgi:hypothetical protein